MIYCQIQTQKKLYFYYPVIMNKLDDMKIVELLIT